MADIDLPPPERLQAFTLTEVLVTLVVIGIVAALTIPNMMNNSNGEEFRAGFKKSVLSLKQAVRLHYIAGGLSPLKYTNNTDLINDLFKTRMNVLEVKGNPFKSGYKMTDCDFTNKGNPVCTEYTPDVSNTLITQDGYIYYFVENKRADGAIPIVVDVNGQRRPNKPTINKNEPKDQYTVLLYDDIYLTQKQIRDPDPGCTEPSCYACTDPSCFCTDPTCTECTDPSCEEPTFDPDPDCTGESCSQTPDPECTDPSCGSQPTDPTNEPTPDDTTPDGTTPTEPTEPTEDTEPTCVKQSIPANCVEGSYAEDGCTYNCTQYCTNQSKPSDCAYGHNNEDCSYTCEKWNESKPANCLDGYNDTNGSYICSQYCTNESKPDDCEEGYNADDCSYVCTKKKTLCAFTIDNNGDYVTFTFCTTYDYKCSKKYSYSYYLINTNNELWYDTYLSCKRNSDYPSDAMREIEPPPARPSRPARSCWSYWLINDYGSKEERFYSCTFYKFNARYYDDGRWESYGCQYTDICTYGVTEDEVYDCGG